MRGVLVGVGAVAALAVPASALGATITVNSAADTVASDGVCTLREAIEAANTNTASGGAGGECAAGAAGADTIQFSGLFDGNVGSSTISLGSALPPISEAVTIAGGTSCTGPCVGIDGNNQNAITVSAANVSLSGLAISGAATAIRSDQNASFMSVSGSWFGLRVDQTEVGNAVGVEVGGNDTAIGGLSDTTRNVFALSSDTALVVLSADRTAIFGNYFGMRPDGTTPASLASGIMVKVVAQSGNPLGTPRQTVIGGEDTGTPTVCDGTCNVISNWSTRGIDLHGNGITEGPAGETSIDGNFVGLDKDGTDDLAPVNAEGIRVGNAASVTIGGSVDAERNYVLGLISFFADATGAVVRNNFIGLNASGSQRVGGGGAVDTPNSAPFPSGMSVIDNRIAAAKSGPEQVVAIEVGNTSTVRGNTAGIGTTGLDVGGGDSSVFIWGNDNTIGGSATGQGNVMGNANVGITVVGSNNSVVGNNVGLNADESDEHPVQNASVIIVVGDDNTVGGTTAASENAFLSQNQDAIAVGNDDADRNSILRNHGRSENNEFVELFPDFGPGNDPNGPNDGIQAPGMDVDSTPSLILGENARPGATVRIYRTPNNFFVSEIDEFIGSATADGSGAWSLSCPSPACENPPADNDFVTANQTDIDGNSSEMATAVPASFRPETVIDSGPDDGALINDATPTYGFSSTEAGSSFSCRFDSAPFTSCSGPGATHTPPTPLSDGQHTFEVRATDSVGSTDQTPAIRTMTVDATAPDTSLGTSGPAEGATTDDSTPTFDFGADESATFECRFDTDAFAACSGPGEIHTPASPLADGIHIFEVRATDLAGNVEGSPASRVFSVDATAPETTIGATAPAEGAKIGDSTPTFEFSATEAATFECRIDAGPFAGCSGPGNTHTPTTPLADGPHTFEVRATDAVGNVDSSPAARSFTVDTSRSISLEASKKKVKKGKKVTLSGAVDAPGDEACESGQTVQLQKGKTAGALKTFTTVQTNGDGAYSKKVKVKKTLLYRAVAPAGGSCVEAESGTVKVKVKPPS